MSQTYTGTVVENSLQTTDILKKLTVHKTWQEGDWILDTVSLDENQIDELVQALRMDEPWYIHL